MSIFRCKIVEVTSVASDCFELFLPNGDRVASGSLSHCMDERYNWEKVLSTGVQLELF